ncbi:DUF4232 domain-containing protein [Leucobacter viscericola]|uniref:DUF4232 domain-containing protein n=1 Tax=Leucobacter viscericola TaxID=2714935 RepID=A0A6G7XDZ2_9MICO|nr:DUF4232 domain-containing protein [Leucobacter viscericola]QIK62830.1 DUF4232 domain-containing protein [Leucobacter viscericola]
MSTLRDPVGPKDRKVYIRRRILVLAGLLAVIAVIVLIIVKPGSSDTPDQASDVKVPSDIATTTATDDAKASKDPQPCNSAQLRVNAITDKSDYAEGELPEISLSVENTGSKACTADLGTAGMQFVISSGDDKVWNSVDCQTDPKNTAVILDPGKPVESEAISWDRTRSSKDTCDVSREPVVAGGATYHLQATAAGVTGAETAPFILN